MTGAGGAAGASAATESRISRSRATCSLMRKYHSTATRLAMSRISRTPNTVTSGLSTGAPPLLPPVYATPVARRAN